jgi:hypothetical protein
LNLQDDEGWSSDDSIDEEDSLDEQHFLFEDEDDSEELTEIDEDDEIQTKGKKVPRFAEEDYEKWQNEERISEKPICPKCGNFPDLIDDEEELSYLGFTTQPSSEISDTDIMYAPLGICTGPCTDNPTPPSTRFGTPLVLPDSVGEMFERRRSQESLLNQEEKDVEGSILFDNLSSDGQIIQPTSHGDDWEIRMQIKSRYSGPHLQKLDPPYRIATKDLKGISGYEGRHQATTPEEARKEASSSKDPLDWFHNLGPDLIELERIVQRTEQSIPIVKERLFITAFLHKSACFKHIEPLWVFASRLGLGYRQVANAFSRWPGQQPAFARKHIENLRRIQPNRESLESVLNACQQIGKFNLDDAESTYIIEEADKLLIKMSESEKNGSNVLQALIHRCNHSSEFSLAEETLPAVGLIESLILRKVIEDAKGYEIKAGLADGILETLFPRPEGGQKFWESTLSESSKMLVARWSQMIDKYIN